MTNGDELGDSNCTWRPGKTAFNPVGHPGKYVTITKQDNVWYGALKP